MRTSIGIGIILSTIAIIIVLSIQLAKSNERYIDLKQRYLEQTLVLEDKLRRFQISSAMQIEEISAGYENQLNQLNHRYNVLSERVRSSPGDAYTTSQMPSNGTLTSKLKPNSTDRCFTESTTSDFKQLVIKNNKLKQELLAIAKAKDELAIKYNALLEIYKRQEVSINKYLQDNQHQLKALEDV